SQISILNTKYNILDTIQSQMDDIKAQNKAILDFFAVLNPESLVVKDSEGNVDLLGGKLTAEGIVAGAFTVKVIDPDAKTIGEAKIVKAGDIKDDDSDGYDDKTMSKDGKIVLVKTKAVSETSKIFTSFENNPEGYSWIEKTKNPGGDYNGFEIHLSSEVSKEININWWIVEEGKVSAN
ncbi:MAG: hypothetical protein V1804_01995, partial [Patescibacteria group bacterium]